MVEVTEIERFWSKEEWDKIKNSYYDELIKRKEITEFNWEEVPNQRYYTVQRTYLDMRKRDPDHDQTSKVSPGPKQLPPHIKGRITVELESENAVEALEIIQGYEQYWPGMDLYTYGLAQSKTEPVSACMILTNYEEEEEEEDEEYEDLS